MKELIDLTKRVRGFNVQYYLERKLRAINQFFLLNNLDSCVLGISGGLDSAVVLKLLIEASNQPDSPIKKIHGLFMPIYSKGITGQDEAKTRVLQLVKSISDEKFFYDERNLTDTADALVAQMYPHKVNPWTIGQMVCIARTPMLYGEAAYLQQEGFNSLVVGTTNRDEGSYIGFFGKASDAMVDLQPIADIHKSEVYALAEVLGVPEVIINATPKGDVWDGKVDEEMIGAPYWFLEMYLISKQLCGTFKWEFEKHYKAFSIEEEELFYKYSMAIEKIHEKNAHKYEVGNPAHFIDVMGRKVKGGW